MTGVQTCALPISAALGVNVSLYPKLNYDPVKDFVPVALFATSPNLLLVHPSYPAKTVREFIAVAKKKGTRLNFSSSGSGSTQHLSGEMLKLVLGADMTHIPYKGSSGARTDIVGGQVDVMFDAETTMAEFARNGQVRMLGSTEIGRAHV